MISRRATGNTLTALGLTMVTGGFVSFVYNLDKIVDYRQSSGIVQLESALHTLRHARETFAPYAQGDLRDLRDYDALERRMKDRLAQLRSEPVEREQLRKSENHDKNAQNSLYSMIGGTIPVLVIGAYLSLHKRRTEPAKQP